MLNAGKLSLLLMFLLPIVDDRRWGWAAHASEQEASLISAPPIVADVISQIETYRHAGQFAEAQALLEAALTAEALPEEQQRLRAALADLHRVWGDDLKKHYAYEEAIAHYEAAFASDQHERRKEAAATLTAIGEAYSLLSQYDTARSYYEWALSLQRETGDLTGASVTLNRIGKSYSDVNQFEKAAEILEQVVTLLREAHNGWEESKALGSLGDAYTGLGQYERAQAQYESALTIARAVHNREEEAHTLTVLSALFRYRGELAQSLTHLNEALTICHEIQDRECEADALNQFGFIFLTTDPPKAIDYFAQALAMAREIRSRDLESALLGNLGQSYHRLGQYDKALEYLTPALTTSRELHSRRQEGIVLSSLGHVYLSRSEYDSAIATFEQSLTIMREVRDRANEGKALGNLGLAYGELSQYDKAIEYYEQALTIAREAKERISEGRTLHNLAAVYYHLGHFAKAIELLEQVVAIHRETGNRPDEAGTLNGLGLAYVLLGRAQHAIPYLQQALVIAREVQDRHLEGSVLNNLAMAHSSLGEYAKALEYYPQALVVLRELKDLHDEAQVLGNLGDVYFKLGQPEQAQQQYKQALTVFREIKARDAEGTALASLCAISSTLGQHDQAREHCEQAVVIAREVGNRHAETLALNNLGEVYAALGDNDKALSSQEQALAIARETQSRPWEGTLLHNLGGKYFALGQYEKAAAYEEQALAVRREVQDRDGEAQTLSNLMDTWRQRGSSPLAIFYGKQAVNTLQEIRGNIRGLQTELQQSFLKSKEDIYRNLADLLITEDRLPEAEQILNLLKEEEYFDFVRRDAKAATGLNGKADFTPAEAAWAQRYQDIADQVTVLGREYGALTMKKMRTPDEDQRVAQLEADLVVARQAFQQVLASLVKEAAVASERNASVQGLQDSGKLMIALGKLGAGTVAVYTLVSEERYRVIVITPDTRIAREYAISRADLNRKILAFRAVLQQPTRDPVPLAQELYQILIGPIAQDLEGAKAETVMWSLDGALRYVPIAALHDGRQYLVEKYRSVVFTPASPWDLQQQPSLKWKGLGLGVSKAHGGFTALPAVPEELQGIIRSGKTKHDEGVLPGVVMLDEAFTEQSMVAGLRERYPVVHIASHFQFRPGNEEESYLLLGDGKRFSIVQLNALYDTLFADVELLSLSACETAVGGIGGEGKEVEGFGVLAQRQGAQAVLATLWSVADTSTKELMQQFYVTRESKKGMSKAEALQQAQLALLRGARKRNDADKSRGVVQVSHDSPSMNEQNNTAPQFVKDPAAPFAHPYYWAPFILIGNWR